MRGVAVTASPMGSCSKLCFDLEEMTMWNVDEPIVTDALAKSWRSIVDCLSRTTVVTTLELQ